MQANVGYQEFPLMRQSALIHFIENLYNKLERRLSKSNIVSLELISEMAKIADKSNVVFIVASISDDSYAKDMLSRLQNNGIQTVDISVSQGRKEYRNLPCDNHPSALANLKYADKLETFLQEKILGGR